MEKSYDQTFMLTMSNKSTNVVHLIEQIFSKKACIAQSALTPVRSVECGLFAQLAFGFFAKKSVFYINP